MNRPCMFTRETGKLISALHVMNFNRNRFSAESEF